MQDKPVALVTGANKGIGLQIAKDLAAHGFTVLVGSRNLAHGEEAAKSIGADARALQLDVTNRASIAAATERIRNELGRLDVLVNNAAISHAGKPGRPLEEMAKSGRLSVASLDEVRAVFETNVFGVIAVAQAMLPLLREAPAGRIVNVSSSSGSLTLNADPKNPHRSMFGTYSSSKTALNAITLAFASAVESTSIKVNAACPGFTATDLNNFQGTRTVQQAAREPVRLALLDAYGPTGTFSNEDGPLHGDAHVRTHHGTLEVTVMSSDLVLVTGASGYIAGYCMLRLLHDGYRVRGTLRSLKRAGEVRQWLTKARGGLDPGATLSFVEAELTNPSGWDAAMGGVRYVLHVASPIPSSMPKDPDDLIVPAREGTLNVMRAASRASVQRVVQTSSLSAISCGCDDPNSRVFTEADWTDPDHKDNVPYTRSKTIAERAAWAELPKLPRSLEWVAINPGLVLGPVLDKDSSASVQLVAKLLKGEIPGLPRLGYPIVDVRDLADLEVRAMTAPQAAGQRYIGSGPFIPLSQIANVLKERLGDKAKKVPTRKLPDWVVKLVGLFDSEVHGQLFELGKVRRPSSAKAEKDLGWSYRPWEDTLVDTATSLEAVGALS